MHDKKIFFLLPICFFYILLCVFMAGNPPQADELRYISYAENLSHGYYAHPKTLELWNGPGYPLFLCPFAKLGIPWIVAKHANAFLVFAGVLFLYRLLRIYLSANKALFVAYLFAVYPPMLTTIPMLLTESISILLVTGFIYYVVLSFRSDKWVNYLVAGIFCCFLILTKVLYAYVVLAGLAISLLLCFRNKKFFKLTCIYFFAFVLCSPYLFYTWSLTGKHFYWANSGGSTLYWMSSPYPNEWGTWQGANTVMSDQRYEHHQPLYLKLRQLNAIEKDILLKQEALKNIRNHPLKYLQNWVCNIGRIWLNYPYSYKYQRPHTMVFTVPNTFILTGWVVALCILVKKLKYLPPEILALMFFAVLFLSASSLVYACSRYLVTIVPVLILLISYGLLVLLKIEFRQQSKNNNERC